MAISSPPPALQSHEVLQFLERLFASYRDATGDELVPPGPLQERAVALWEATFVALSHDAKAEPVYNFGNALALGLWEMSWEEFTQMPSNRCAEPMHREERARFLAEVEKNGYADGYAGTRISKSGKRFRIEGVRCWNVLDTHGYRIGQAACYRRWTFL